MGEWGNTIPSWLGTGCVCLNLGILRCIWAKMVFVVIWWSMCEKILPTPSGSCPMIVLDSSCPLQLVEPIQRYIHI